MKQSSKYCLCTTPNDAPYHEVIEHVIVRPMKELEEAMLHCYFAPSKSACTFGGGLHCIVGDDIGARHSLNRLGPTSNSSSRFFEQEEGQTFANVVHPKNKVWKSAEIHRELLAKLNELNTRVCKTSPKM